MRWSSAYTEPRFRVIPFRAAKSTTAIGFKPEAPESRSKQVIVSETLVFAWYVNAGTDRSDRRLIAKSSPAILLRSASTSSTRRCRSWISRSTGCSVAVIVGPEEHWTVSRETFQSIKVLEGGHDEERPDGIDLAGKPDGESGDREADRDRE